MMFFLFAFTLLERTGAYYFVFLYAAFALCLVVAALLLSVLFFLRQKRRKQQRKNQLRHLFSDLIAETAICETHDDVNAVLQQFTTHHKNLLQKPFPRKVLIRELVKAKDNISGQSADNLRILFEALDLNTDCFAQFTSGKWHQKTSAIQHLAEMQQSRYLVKIYKETNNKNHFIRTEAQIAVVKLTGFKGLRFLTVISHPISQWQQLSLINQLQVAEIEEDKIRQWLSARNESVVEFALRLTAVYKCYDLHNDVAACLQHLSTAIRLQALQVLKEIADTGTAGVLMQHFRNATGQEQREIVITLGELGVGAEEAAFLAPLLHHPDEAIRFYAEQGLRQFRPGNATAVIEPKMPASPTYFISVPEKKAV